MAADTEYPRPVPLPKTIRIIGAYAGDTGDVVIDGVDDVEGAKTMMEKMEYFRDKRDDIRQLLLYEPRGRPTMFINVVLKPCQKAHKGLVIMGSQTYPHMSGSNVICVVTVLIQKEIIQVETNPQPVVLDTPAGLVNTLAKIDNGKCVSVSFENVPAFLFGSWQIGFRDELVTVDIAYGGVTFAMVSAKNVGAILRDSHSRELLQLGAGIKKAIEKAISRKHIPEPVHPDADKGIRGIGAVMLYDEVYTQGPYTTKCITASILPPGRIDRSPAGTGTSALMASLAQKGKLGERFENQCYLGTTFKGSVTPGKRDIEVGCYKAIHTTIEGRAFLTGERTAYVDRYDPNPYGFKVGDIWPPAEK
ncbi:hypothetical protein CNMCM7691_005099 [Aspergillus felis]|uniref:Proline racemase n=1 Tax=Aspergillus felis TaxID=1287682 RepID=A0A8H6VBA9_9EURO|nr:hypothetical protein CNMCM7691_005099 [Aspergillus felis]